MDLWQLKVFCKVIELQSFSKAGQSVRLSQPTVSSHIKDLEAYFDTRLLDRLSRKALPTKAGELLYQYAKRLIALKDETDSAMAEFLGKVKGHLTIGGSTIPGGYLLPRWIGIFSKRYPEVKIKLLVADTQIIIEGIVNGRIEAGIVGARSDAKQIAQTPLIDDELKLIVPAGHKWAHLETISIDEIKNQPFIIREQGSGTLRSFTEKIRRQGHDIDHFKIVAEMGSTEAVKQAIKANVGISVLSRLAVAEDLISGRLIELTIENLDLKRHFYLTTHHQRSLSPLCREFTTFLRQLVETAKG